MSLENKTVIVTGASTGIGRETSIELGKIGMNVVIGNRNEKLGNEVVDIIKSSGGNAKFLKTDVSIEKDVKNLTQFALDEFGEFNYAFNNSGLLGDVEPISDQCQRCRLYSRCEYKRSHILPTSSN